MKFNTYFLALLLWSLTNISNAQTSMDSIPPHESFKIDSKIVGESRTINIWLPDQYKANFDSLPVLYMLDGGLKEDFPHVANTLSDLVRAKKIKPIMLVGIENTQRRRDLTGHTDNPKDKEIAPIVGGSEKFRSFISQELLPEISKRYRTTQQKGIIGESLAGLFVTETFLLQPQLFDFYIAFDPSLWWNDQYLVKQANSLLQDFQGQQKTLWFAGSGAKDIFRSTDKLSAILKEKKVKNLVWMYAPERKEAHHTIFRATKEKAIIWTLTQLAL